MGRFVASTSKEQQEMLKAIGFTSFDEMFADVPDEVKLKEGMAIPQGLSEMEVSEKLEEMAESNKVFKQIFRGAGAYDRYIPAAVKKIVSKEEFVTAYTPYQAEISQGILQSIFEFQTMMCELTGLDVSNASVYDGATAAAEATAMCKDRKRSTVLVSATTNPQVMDVIKTYCYGSNTKIVIIPEKGGVTDMEALAAALANDTACFYVQQPNFFGILEDYDALADTVHDKGVKFIMGSDPVGLAILKTPAEYGADIAVGEGQSLGMPMSFGGPYLGFMTAASAMMRKLPGRIVGETTDDDGNRAFVLTLQAREQHIRREKAGSNICSNQALCALTAGVYLSTMSKSGLRDVAMQSASKAHYLQEELAEIGFEPKYMKPFFNEFVTVTPIPAAVILGRLEDAGILGGLPLEENEILWCATEKNSKESIDKMIEILKEVCYI
ncbi:MAG: aminomethyl-transferring glycine dehydrogenase subunit GcvPA [Clostridiales bacterium]|nr:aminomethyl-transferring glycine dehydrogenase subunit GcvPA [Clostridiales bacterium]